MSKYGGHWAKKRKQWIERNQPDDAGNYTCCFCGNEVHIDVVTLDHIIKLSDLPQLRYNFENLRPMHERCNNKASRFIEDPAYRLRQLKGRKDRNVLLSFIKETNDMYERYGFAIKTEPARPVDGRKQ